MNEFSLHPAVYFNGTHDGIVPMLQSIWVKKTVPGKGTMFVISGFANYNGGVRFYNTFREHVLKGGKVEIFVSGSTAQRLTSKQVVKELLDCGAHVHVINRKRLVHAKCYGYAGPSGQHLIVTSANFTGPGMSQNVEASLLLDSETTKKMGFSWEKIIQGITSQNWDVHMASEDANNPAWKLLYDEIGEQYPLDESEEMSLVITLSHADTARIQSEPGLAAGKGSQYFWLSKDCFGFFPPLTIKNTRGYKSTYSAIISLNYVDLGTTDPDARITFEAENNFDFRLGTGKLRYTKLAHQGDIAILSRIREGEYKLKIIKKESKKFHLIKRYAINFIGHQGKQYGFIPNKELEKITKSSI